MVNLPNRPADMKPGDIYLDFHSGKSYTYDDLTSNQKETNMSKKHEKKSTKWAKTPERGIDLRVPVYVTDDMVKDVEALLLGLAPHVGNKRLADSLSRYPWKDPELELDLEKIAVATPEEVMDVITEDEVKTLNSLAGVSVNVEPELSLQDMRDLAAMNVEEPAVTRQRETLEETTAREIAQLDRL